MDFKRVEIEFNRLKKQYEMGAITEAEFKEKLEDLMIEDENGNWWMIGYETGLWHRNDGSNWVREDPPGYTPQQPEPSQEATAQESAARQRAEAIRLAREREQLERQQYQPNPVVPPVVESPAAPQQSKSRWGIIIGGVVLLMLLCTGGGYIAWPIVFPNTPTLHVDPPIITETFTPTITKTFTPTNTQPPIPITDTPSVTPSALEDPEQFMIFYWKTIINDKKYQLAWDDLLTDYFKQKNNPDGYEPWKATMEKNVDWKQPSMTTKNLSESMVIVSIPVMTFKSSREYQLYDLNFCLVRVGGPYIWKIDYKATCGL